MCSMDSPDPPEEKRTPKENTLRVGEDEEQASSTRRRKRGTQSLQIPLGGNGEGGGTGLAI